MRSQQIFHLLSYHLYSHNVIAIDHHIIHSFSALFVVIQARQKFVKMADALFRGNTD